MRLTQDFERVRDVVKRTDPSFARVDRAALKAQLEDVKARAAEGAREPFLLSAMRLLALAGNGHTRLIPNDAISVLPVRFVAVGASVVLTRTAVQRAPPVLSKLIAVNGMDVAEIERAAAPFLAGTPQRRRVIGPILLAWPAALAHLGAVSTGDVTQYRLKDAGGAETTLELRHDETVPATELYPRNEHGRSCPGWSPRAFAEIHERGAAGVVIDLPSFFDPERRALPDAIGNAAAWIRAHSERPLVLDVRGNSGGDFLLTMPLIDAVVESAGHSGVVVLVDKFTFSAAIVFVAILKHRLGKKLTIVGEEMGDGLRFYAEGDTLDLPASGAAVRYSSALHDWETGTVDETTPADIARVIVPVGRLEIASLESDRWKHLAFDWESRAGAVSPG
ncbi:MAG: peptidase S41 [Pseudomonadota bacterium]